MKKTLVVILNWNGRKYLEKFLPSVCRTTPSQVGVVVVDNGSTDDSVCFLKEYFPEVGLLELDNNYGFAGGYNRALEQLQADYYILLNSDIETTDGWCEPLICALDSDPAVFAASPKIRAYSNPDYFEYAGAAGGFIDALGYPFCRGRILSTVEKDEGQYDSERQVFWATGACMIVRGEIFRRLGGFDASFFAHMEEIDLCWRAQSAGYINKVVPASAVYHLGGGTLANTSPKKLYLNFRNNLAMLYKNLPDGKRGRVIFLRMTLDGAAGLVYLLSGKKDYFNAVRDAHRNFRKMKPCLREKRQSLTNRSVKMQGIYKGSILLRYFFGRRKFGNMM